MSTFAMEYARSRQHRLVTDCCDTVGGVSIGPPDQGERHQGSLREAQRRFTTQHILDAAITVFVERGYAASTVDDIIEQAGTSRRTFYAHFGNRSHVLVAVANSLLPEIQENYRQLDKALAQRSAEPLREWIMSIIDWCRRRGGLLPVWQQGEAIEPELVALRQELVARFPELMPGYFARWPIDQPEEPRLRLVLLSVQLDKFWAYWSPRDMNDFDQTFVANVLTNIWDPALQAPPNAVPEPMQSRCDDASLSDQGLTMSGHVD